MNKVKVIKAWGHYRLGSIHKFTAAETRALKALGNVVDYVEPEVKPKADEAKTEETKEKKRTYKRKDMKAED